MTNHPSENNGKSTNNNMTVSPTSQDVADLAKVSRATVSYVLNNVPGARVSEATRKRVLQAAAELGYVPHEIASSLRARRSDLVLLPFFDWPYNQSSIRFLQDLAYHLDQLGYTVLLRFFGHGEKKTLARKIAAFHPVGVIVVAEELTQSDVNLLSRNGVRAVLAYGHTPHIAIPSIAVDFTQVGERVASYLIGKGHRAIAAIVPRDKRILALGLQRFEGLAQAAARLGATVERIDLNYDAGETAALAEQWKHGAHPTAVFTYNDEYGMLLSSALQDVGLSVPADIALVGCDNLAMCDLVRPRLSSVVMRGSTPAREISAYFHQLIQGESLETDLRIPINFQVVERDSS